ncbi:30S ribosomal protein S6 [Candidatus Sumerlaeota bacterium]|nr:30S ribosomal protein S6 [Candidatus Sumerlaeota bacterium]MBI3736824.1 30S ribosomal protein S6 [Candidatus Sumerlaeota bacterium]
MLNYEACVILNAQLPDAEIEALIEKLATQLTSGGAKIKETAKWGKRKLAYEIGKALDGYYVVYYFDLEKAGDTLTNFQRVCKYDDNVLREMIVNVPAKKKKHEVRQLVPSPGWLAEFSMKLRPHHSRRRDFSRGPRGGYEDRGHGGPSQAPAPAPDAPPVQAEPAPAASPEPAS